MDIKDNNVVIKKVSFKKDTSDNVFSEFVKITEAQGVFHSCGNPDNKWVCLKFENEIDCLAWCLSMGIAELI
jgi:hypothetical protein